jgi:hypothetical protein
VESFGCAADAIGPIESGMALFAITRGQWSMLDALLHVLDQVGRSKVSIWTWTVAAYEVEVLTRVRMDRRITDGLLVIDYGARAKNATIVGQWQKTFGLESVKHCRNHAKIATVESESGLRCLLRGSMNLNHNPRFEQFDLTEGGGDFDVIRRVEDDLPCLPNAATWLEVAQATKLPDAWEPGLLDFFQPATRWAK